MFSNRTYDVLKLVTLHVLPALGTLIFALGTIWGWSWAEPVVGTVTAVTTALATLLGISSHGYNKRENPDDEGGAEG